MSLEQFYGHPSPFVNLETITNTSVDTVNSTEGMQAPTPMSLHLRQSVEEAIHARPPTPICL
jgi:hypothetical protein